ncbi:hypothetical protein OEZ86_004392 [Tetradesmus obliquus]|nr:hypothetical protein OEZ86_004392 [Tetradesmus obliquus]
MGGSWHDLRVMMSRNSQLQWSFGVIALLLVAAGHAVEAGSSARKLSQQASLPSVKDMATRYMCGAECAGCLQRDTGRAAAIHDPATINPRVVPLENAVGLTGGFAAVPEECALINFNNVIKAAFENVTIKAVTGNGCTFRGFRTWGDVAALWSTPQGGTPFNPSMLLATWDAIALLATAVNRQAAWVASQPCAMQAQTFGAFLDSVRGFTRADVFAQTSLGATPQSKCSPEVPGLCLAALKAGVQGYPAVTCDCSKLNPDFAASAGKCRGQTGQALLNGLLSFAGASQIGMKLGTPMIASCSA